MFVEVMACKSRASPRRGCVETSSPTAAIEGHHLDLVTRPELVATAVGRRVTTITGWTGQYGCPYG